MTEAPRDRPSSGCYAVRNTHPLLLLTRHVYLAIFPDMAQRIAILGVGLLGGSIGLGLRAAGVDVHITGYGHRRPTLDSALEFGAIDAAATTPADAVREAELVILCTPVGLLRQMLQEIAPALRSGAVVTDVGSTKRSVVRAAQELLPAGRHFVGSHPMAGSEKRGIEYARADLFTGALCILTPTACTDPASLAYVEKFWQSLHMRTTRLSPEEHDAALADISHLPHVLAGALVAMQSPSVLPLAGKGFLDTTRIASGDAALWRDILLDNRDHLKQSISRLSAQLKMLQGLLSEDRAEELTRWLAQAADRRDQLAREKLREISSD